MVDSSDYVGFKVLTAMVTKSSIFWDNDAVYTESQLIFWGNIGWHRVYSIISHKTEHFSSYYAQVVVNFAVTHLSFLFVLGVGSVN
jgi:hypothetical protein